MLNYPISLQNPFTQLLDTCWDANNPNNNSAIIPSNGSSLATIYDTGNKGNNVAQATSALQPTYITNAINGQAAFGFSGTQYMSLANAASNNYVGAMTLVFVAETTTANTLTQSSILSLSDGTTGFVSARHGRGLDFNAIGGTDYIGTIASEWTINTFYYKMIIYNGSNAVTFYSNHVQANTFSGGAVSATTGSLYFGSQSSGTNIWSGKVALCGWAWRAFNAGEVSLMNSAINARYGL